MKKVLKSEIAQAAGVCTRTLQRWMQKNRQALLEHGLRPTDRYVGHRALLFICHEYDIDPGEFDLFNS